MVKKTRPVPKREHWAHSGPNWAGGFSQSSILRVQSSTSSFVYRTQFLLIFLLSFKQADSIAKKEYNQLTLLISDQQYGKGNQSKSE